MQIQTFVYTKPSYNVKTFTFKDYGLGCNCYQYKYQYKSFETLGTAIAYSKKWVKKNYPTAGSIYTEIIRHKNFGYTLKICFSYRNLDSNVYWGAYGQYFRRVVEIEFSKPMRYRKNFRIVE